MCCDQIVDLRPFANKRFPRGTDGRSSVSAQGTIAGLAIFDNTAYTLTTSRWTNAATKWVLVTNKLLTHAQVYVGPGVLSFSALNQVVTPNEGAGIINSSSEYDDRPIPVGMRSYSLRAQGS